jgi:lantibiotic biosynthesis protein
MRYGGSANESCVVANIAVGGFFVLRTPLLPFRELLEWGETSEIQGPVFHPHTSRIEPEEVWQARVELLRERMRRFVARPEVRRALYIASASLDEAIPYWERDPNSKKGLQVERALVRYMARMCARATPFGLLSGCSVGTISPRASADQRCVLQLGQIKDYRLTTRLDFDFLECQAHRWGCDEGIRNNLRYWPNPTLHTAGGGLHYLETRFEGDERRFHFIRLGRDALLDAVISRAGEGATLEELVHSLRLVLSSEDVGEAAITDYVSELIDNDVLVSDLRPTITGTEPLDGLLNELERIPAGEEKAAELCSIKRQLVALDAKGMSACVEDQRRLATSVQAAFGAKTEISKLFHVDLRKPLAEGNLPFVVIEELIAAASVLLRLGKPEIGLHRDLHAFRGAFFDRYGDAAVPLLEALDEKTGLSFGSNGGYTPPTLGPGTEDEQRAQGRKSSSEVLHPYLLERLIDWARTHEMELVLVSADIPPADDSAPEVPESFCLNATLVAPSAFAVSRGDFSVYVRSGGGPPGAALLGRFCHADPILRHYVTEYLRDEERDQEAVYAEIVFAPEGRSGNLVCRPAFRNYEIVCGGRSGATSERQLAASDLLVRVSRSGVILYSRRLGKRVIPRLTNAHSFWKPKHPSVYRFLCALQLERTAGIRNFEWGALNNVPFLPRVRVGRAVLSCARWRLSSDELKPLEQKRRYDCFMAVQELRRRRCLPRWVLLLEEDLVLPVDLSNPLSVDAFVHNLRRGREAIVSEMYPQPSDLCCVGPEGLFCHELLVPFIRIKSQSEDGYSEEQEVRIQDIRSDPTRIVHPAIPRTLPPGGNWLYAKLYGGPVVLDEVIIDLLPLIDALIRQGLVARWFFVRYADPREHLRVRFECPSADLAPDLFRCLAVPFNRLISSGRIWKVQFDTYEREIERYGGEEGISASEELFCADSLAVVRIARLLKGESPDFRWQAALLGVDTLFADFGLQIDARHRLAQKMSAWARSRFRNDVDIDKRLSDMYREERKMLRNLVDNPLDSVSPFKDIREILEQRSARMAPIVERLQSIVAPAARRSNTSALVESYAHMHINRLRSTGQQFLEAGVYEFLRRLYGERLARDRENLASQ